MRVARARAIEIPEFCPGKRASRVENRRKLIWDQGQPHRGRFARVESLASRLGLSQEGRERGERGGLASGGSREVGESGGRERSWGIRARENLRTGLVPGRSPAPNHHVHEDLVDRREPIYKDYSLYYNNYIINFKGGTKWTNTKIKKIHKKSLSS